MVSPVTKNDEAITLSLILSRSVDAENGNWPKDVAQGIMLLKLAASDRDRMHELAKLARAGSLSAQEEIEIETYRQATGFLDLLKAKARISLLGTRSRA